MKATKKRNKKASASKINSNTNRASFFEVQVDAINNSFASIRTKRFWESAWYDGFWLISILVLLFFVSWIINTVSEPVLPGLMKVNDLKTIGDPSYEDEFASISESAIRAVQYSGVAILAGYVLFLFFTSLFYGKAWSIAKKDDATSNYIAKLFFVNLVWLTKWMVLFILLFVVLPDHVISVLFLLLVMLVAWYSDQLLRCIYVEKSKMFAQFWTAIKATIRNLHWLLFHAVVTSIVSFVFLFVLGLVAAIPFLFGLLWILATVLLIGFSRNYLLNLMKRLA